MIGFIFFLLGLFIIFIWIGAGVQKVCPAPEEKVHLKRADPTLEFNNNDWVPPKTGETK